MKKVKIENNPKAFIFLGRSGCGKGTQAELLIEKLKKVHGKHLKTIHIESGALLRKFAKGKTYTEKHTKSVMQNGLLVPEAVIVSQWMAMLNHDFTGKENIVFDGTPRKIREAQLLDDTLKFFNFHKPTVICINVSDKWSEERLFGRARKDDTKNSIEKRLAWYETEVMPVLNFYRSDSFYNVLDVNGEQTIEDVHKEVLAKLKLNI